MKQLFIILLLLLCTYQLFSQSSWQVRLIPQIAIGTKNTVERPNNEATRISLDSDFERKSPVIFSPRFEVEYSFRRHHIIATAALVKDRFHGKSHENIHYNNVVFNSGSSMEIIYSFNTYRLSYRYRIVERPRINFEIGATVLLRDAYISFKNENHKTQFDNVGVAPLLSYYLEWRVTDRFSLLSYGDAFAVKAGRAEDIFAGMKYQFLPLISASLGYRLLEGGSDSERVYTMATFHFVSLGVEFKF